MKRIDINLIAFFTIICLAYNAKAYNESDNFCLNGDKLVAQESLSMMCLTAPILFCPPTYFGCPTDNLDPVITGSPMVMPGDINCPTPVVSFTDVITTNNTCLKIMHRTWEATYPPDSASLKLHSSCQQTLFLEDVIPPVINNCPSDLTLDLTADCDSVAIWAVPTVTENCDLLSFTTTHFSGSTFSSGTTQVTYTAHDRCGFSTQCIFNVTVEGSCCKAPAISCPPLMRTCPIIDDISPVSTGFATATATDISCGNPIITYQDSVVSIGSCSGAMTIERIWTAMDSSQINEISTCHQTIEIIDIDAPMLSNIPNDITVSGNGTGCSVRVFWESPISSDNCGINTMTSNFANGDFFTEGTSSVVYTVTDNCGLTSTASFLVTIVCLCDTEPEITCPPNYTNCPTGSYPNPSLTGVANGTAGSAICSDPIISFTDQVVSSGPCVSEYEIRRTWIAMDPDDSTLSSSCIQDISLQDNGGPTISNVPSDITLFKKGSHCVMPVTWTDPIYSDDCTLSSTGSNIANGSEFNGGTTTVIFTAVDICGNIATASFNVTIECSSCNTAPLISCPPAYTNCTGGFIPATSLAGEPVVTEQGGSCGPAIVFHTDALTGFGNCLGSFYVDRVWTAFDQYHPELVSTCVQTISVDDNTAPVISTPPDDIILTANGSNCQIAVNWIPPTATDDCGIASFTSSHNPSDIFSEGQTIVTYTAIDNCGNVSTSSFKVTINCEQCSNVPTIICPPNYFDCPLSSSDPAVTGFASGVLSGPNCSGMPTINYSDMISTNASCLTASIIERTWTATSPYNLNLSSSCTQTIQLEDNTPPVFTFVPNDIIINGSGSNCNQVATWATPIATDNCSNVTISSSHSSGDIFSEGQSYVTITASDACGNISTASFVVNISCAVCSTPPSIICPPNYIACPGSSFDPSIAGQATANISGANCSGSATLTFVDNSPYSIACPDANMLERTWTATNPLYPNLSSSCVQIISLTDDIMPVISNIPNNITASAIGTGCTVDISWVEPSASDNCNLTFFEGSHISGSAFPEGTTTVIYTATDACGNSVTSSFVITVVCEAACNIQPTITCPTNFTTCPTAGIPSPSVSGIAIATSGASACGNPVLNYDDVIINSGPCPTSKIVNRTWTASYSNYPSLSASCTQVISLIDNEAPVFTSCPADIVLLGTPNTGSGTGCFSVASWTIPTIIDNCSNVTLQAQNSLGQNVVSGSTFYEGTTQVIYTATDGCGNTASCDFNVTINCDNNSGSSLACPDNIIVPCGPNGVANVTWSAPTYSGSCGSCGGEDIDGFVYMGSFGGSEYYCSINPANWNNAHQICEDNGGYLACIGTEEENSFLASLLTLQSAWIGLTDLNKDGQFDWTCGESLDYTNWYPGQPNNFNGNQECVEMLNNGQWNDQYPYYLLEFIMERPCSFVSQVSGPSPGSDLPGGTYVVTYETSDLCGPIETCSFNIIVEDRLSISCPTDIVVSASANSQGVQVDWDLPELSSCCSDCSSSGNFIQGFVYMGSLNGHHYYCSTESATWDAAEANCIANGGHLAVINNSAENTFLANVLTLQSAWIGASDIAKEGTFTWTNGDPFSFTNWYPRQPNNFNGRQNYIEMLNNGQWNDQYGSFSLEYILEIESCLTIEQTSGPTPGSILPPGSNHTVSYTASDGCGNVETCAFDITVELEDNICNPGGLNSSCHYIEQCIFGAINHTSGNNNGYRDFTNICTGAGASDELGIKLVPGFGNCSSERVFWTVWIDYNRDGDFYDANELAAYGSGSHAMTGVITMPNKVFNGQGVVRIIMRKGAYADDPCQEYPLGETEDYCIQFSGIGNISHSNNFAYKSLNTENPSLLTESTMRNEIIVNDLSVNVYPNPVSELLTIESNDMEHIKHLLLYSQDGKLIEEIDFNADDRKIQYNVSKLNSGLYNLIASYENGQRIIKKIIVQN